MKDVDKLLFPESGEIIIKDGVCTAQMIDAEIDPFECSFNYDRCVVIDVSNYNHIYLSIENLEKLKQLIIESEKYYDKNL